MISALPEMGGAANPRSELGPVPDAAPPTHTLKPEGSKTPAATPPANAYSAHPADGAKRLIGKPAMAPSGKDLKEAGLGVAKESAKAFLEGDKSVVDAAAYGAGKYLGEEIGMAPTEAVVTDVCSDLGYSAGTEGGEACKEAGMFVMGELYDSVGFSLPEEVEYLIGEFASGLVEGAVSKGVPSAILAKSYYDAKAWDKATGFSEAMSGEKAKPIAHPSHPGMEFLPDETFEEDCKPSTARPGMEECKLR